ncbi:CpaF/VirB11 family protein [Helicobacter sp. 11S03491-1]|uniref:CpaF/VirB11 family protein n=1 Tax=Helicobacter sp. 11S03491-1 TaxID=1476196 RepID=UPI000BA70E5F|nr:CpaF/VirB11 family protein [Helicobacter sp. 11S03491-1]PAF42169.1 ATPase [Helicobacter sp. 11S03491-1]
MTNSVGGSRILQVLVEKLKPYLTLDINEVQFNGSQDMYLVKGNSYEKVAQPLFDERFLMNFCEQLANSRNLFFNIQVPHLSCSIPNTRYRVNALHPSINAQNKICMCIRVPNESKFPIEAFQLGAKVKSKGIDYQDILNLTTQAKNILVSGGTASGKTSFVNCLIEKIPLEERIITIEDSPELHLKNPNLVSILVGKNEDSNYSYETALNDAMRMSPQRLLLGEIDTKNVSLFLRLANTGHSGMISTLHSNSVEDAIFAINLNIKIGSKKDIDSNDLLEFFIRGMDFIIQIKKINNERVIEDVLDVKKDLKKALGKN